MGVDASDGGKVRMTAGFLALSLDPEWVVGNSAGEAGSQVPQLGLNQFEIPMRLPSGNGR